MTETGGVFAWDSPEFRRLLAQHQPGPAFALIRERSGLTQEKFANLVNWGRTNTGRIERGERQALYDIRELTRVADALGIPRAALLPALLGTRNQALSKARTAKESVTWTADNSGRSG